MNSGQFDDQSFQKSADQLDQKLVTKVQKGDRTAFDLLLVKYQSRVASIVSRYLDDPSVIAEITQEIFIRAYRTIHSFRGDSAFYTWLFRISLSQAKAFLDRQVTQKTQQAKLYSRPLSAQKASIILVDSPEYVLNRSALAEGIENALSVMPAELSIALMLREFDGLSYQEISNVMECPVETIRSRIFRARELLDNTIKSFSEC